MEPLCACFVLMATALTVTGSPVQGLDGDTAGSHSSVFGAASYFESNGNGKSVNNGENISIINDNGKVEITINGKKVDLAQATVLEDNDKYTVYEPAGIPGAKITIFKANGQIGVDYGHAHYQSLTSEMAKAELSKSMQGMRKELNRMHTNLSRVFSRGFPFNVGIPDF